MKDFYQKQTNEQTKACTRPIQKFLEENRQYKIQIHRNVVEVLMRFYLQNS